MRTRPKSSPYDFASVDDDRCDTTVFALEGTECHAIPGQMDADVKLMACAGGVPHLDRIELHVLRIESAAFGDLFSEATVAEQPVSSRG